MAADQTASIEIRLKNAERLIKDLDRATDEVKRLQTALLGLGNTKAAAKIGQVGTQAVKTGGRLKTLVGTLRALRGGLLALGIGLVIRRMAQMVTEAVKVKQAFDGIKQTLLAVTDSNEEYNRAQALVLDTARRLGQQVTSLGKDYANFLASTKELDLSQQAIEKVFIQVAEAARVLNLPVERVKLVFLALSQTASKGVATMEELRRQLGDSLPGILPRLAKELGKTTAELFEMIRAGDLLAEEALPAIGRAAAGLAGGQVLEASRQLAANLTRLSTEADLAKKAVIDLAEEGLNEVAAEMEDLIANSAGAQAALADLTVAGAQTGGVLASLAVNLLEIGRIVTGTLLGTLEAAFDATPVGRFGNAVSDAVNNLTAFKIAFEETGDSIAFFNLKLAEAQKKTFFEFISDAKKADEEFRKSAANLAKERLKIARITADELAKIAVTLGKNLRDISKESADQIKNIEELSAKERQEILAALGAALVETERETAEDRAAAAQFIITTARNEADIRLESNEALRDRLAAIEQEVVSNFRAAGEEILAGARISNARREELALELSTKILKIEQDRIDKIEDAREEFNDKIKGGDNREEAEKELSDKVVAIFEDETQKKISLIESLTKSVEKSVTKQIKLDEKLAIKRLRSLAKFRAESLKVFKELEELSFGGAGDEAASNLQGLRKELASLSGIPVADLTGDQRLRIQELRQEIAKAGEQLQRVGNDAQIAAGGIKNLGVDLAEFSRKSLEKIQGLVAGNKDFERSFQSLGEAERLALRGALLDFEELAVNSRVTQTDIRTLEGLFKAFGLTGKDSVTGIVAALDQLGTAATGAEKIAGDLAGVGDSAGKAQPLVQGLAAEIEKISSEDRSAKVRGLASSFATLGKVLSGEDTGIEQLSTFAEALTKIEGPLDTISKSLPLLPPPLAEIVATVIQLVEAKALEPLTTSLLAIVPPVGSLAETLPTVATATSDLAAAADVAEAPLGLLQEALVAIGAPDVVAGLNTASMAMTTLKTKLDALSGAEGFAAVQAAARELSEFLANDFERGLVDLITALLGIQDAFGFLSAAIRETREESLKLKNQVTETAKESKKAAEQMVADQTSIFNAVSKTNSAYGEQIRLLQELARLEKD